MLLRDKQVDWLEKRIYLPLQAFQTFVTGAGVSDGDPVNQEISSFGFVGGQVNAAGDAWAHVMMVPYDLDRSRQVRVRVWFTSSSSDDDTPTWLVTYSALAEGGALVAPVTALDTVVAAYATAITANTVIATAFGVILRNTIGTTAAFLNWKVECDAVGGASANELSFLGLELRYTPRKMSGQEKNLRAGRRLLTEGPLGVQLHATQE